MKELKRPWERRDMITTMIRATLTHTAQATQIHMVLQTKTTQLFMRLDTLKFQEKLVQEDQRDLREIEEMLDIQAQEDLQAHKEKKVIRVPEVTLVNVVLQEKKEMTERMELTEPQVKKETRETKEIKE